jgi:glycosyltransferase involved in cell wall biosynthesis
MPQVCLVIPCFNEARRLATGDFIAFVESDPSHHLCFVNDGSSDATAEVIDGLKARGHGRIDTLQLSRNAGKAEAVRRGVLHAAASHRFEILGYWDADLSTPLGELQRMTALLAAGDACQFVLGTRLKCLGADVHRSAMRHFLGRVFATAASLLLSLPVYDSQCGAKAFRADAADELFRDPFSTRWLFDVELLARLRNHLGRDSVLASVAEMPLRSWREVGGSKLGIGHMAAIPVELMRIHRRYNRR